MNKFKKILIIPACLSLLMLAACGSPETPETKPEVIPLSVKGQTVAQSHGLKQQYEYPALVLSEQEAKVIAKTSGTAKQVNFKLGDKVRIGSILAKIDDINQGGALGSSLSSGQIRQAQLGAEQAEANKRNFVLTSNESLKSAQIAYDSTKIASEQARLSLENREKGISQSYNDLETDAGTIADAAANTCYSVITGINNITGYDASVVGDLTYKNNLGVTNSQLAIDAKNLYEQVRDSYKKYTGLVFADNKIKVAETIKLVESVKKLTDTSKNYIDASITGTLLPPSVLSGFQAAVAGYQAQINAALAQLKSVNQASENIKINNDTNADALTKAYELAQQQEKNAAQVLEQLRVNIKSTLEAADLQYRNALVALQSVVDIHLAIAPISGKITQSFVSLGDTVSAGQLLATISSGESQKFQFYIDESVLKTIAKNQAVIIKNNANKEIPGKIISLASQADAMTKRFLVEVAPTGASANDFSLGTVVNILIDVEKKSQNDNIILPLSAITIGQNDTSIFIIENNQAKKITVAISSIQGETAEIKTDLPPETVIITDGNKLVQDGEAVKLTE